MTPRPDARSLLRSEQTGMPYHSSAKLRRSHRYSWLLNSWTNPADLGELDGGTEFVTIGVPDDFFAVRAGFANAHSAPWQVKKIIACASSSWNDCFNPLDGQHRPRGAEAWSTMTFREAGVDRSVLVTDGDAPSEIIMAGVTSGHASDETTNPAWTFTDWVPCASVGTDPATGMRVLMLRALVPGNQSVTYTRGMMAEFGATSSVNKGYGHFSGGLKRNMDLVSNPDPMAIAGMTAGTLQANHLVNGHLICLVQVLTRNAGIVGLVCGDSHQSGTSSTSHVNNFLTQCLLSIGAATVGDVPIGVVSAAAGGLMSQQIFPRMMALLPAVRPAFVVLPGWSANEYDGEGFGTAKGANVFFSRMLLAAEAVRDAGALPLFITPFPRDQPFMTGGLPIWLAQREALLRLRASGELVFDATPLLGETENHQFTGTYLDGLSSDTVHPNDAGHAVVAGALIPLVRELVGLSRTNPASSETAGST